MEAYDGGSSLASWLCHLLTERLGIPWEFYFLTLYKKKKPKNKQASDVYERVGVNLQAQELWTI